MMGMYKSKTDRVKYMTHTIHQLRNIKTEHETIDNIYI